MRALSIASLVFLELGGVHCTESDVTELPDLVVESSALARDVGTDWALFAPNACAVQEGCVRAPGVRRLLRFTTQVANRGTADLLIGVPDQDDERFVYSACHGHYHFKDFVRQELLDADGQVAVIGRKLSFCLTDSERVDPSPTVADEPRYDCRGIQGLQAGWSDVYPASLECQYVDITDLRPGSYALHVTVNADRTLSELSYDDDHTAIPIEIPDAATELTTPCDDTSLQRNCGWDLPELVRTCTPDEIVRIACGRSCPDEPSCTGDPVLRVCGGEEPCPAEEALAMDDDGCEDTCPAAAFTCPSSGTYTVMTASRYAADEYSCELSVL